MIHVGGKAFELVLDHKNGYNFEAFRDRYSEVLDRYDYIVGDWGYSQLRLKGFFKENGQKGNKDACFSGIHDYLNEYCNFGCAYFIVKKLGGKQSPQQQLQQPQQAQPNQQQHQQAGPSQQQQQSQRQQPTVLK